MLNRMMKLSLVIDLKEPVIDLRAFVSVLAASAHCIDGFKLFVMITPRSFYFATISRS